MRKLKALARCFLIRCKCCRIYFLTHCSNRCQLKKIRCPFGCREEDDRRRSIQRSVAYYRKHPGRKREQNEKRYRLVPSSSAGASATAQDHDRGGGDSPEPPSAKQSQADEAGCGGQDPGSVPECPPELAEVLPKAADLQLMEQVRVIVSLIEGRKVTLHEIWQALLHFWRQRTVGRRRKIDHIIAWLNTKPP